MAAMHELNLNAIAHLPVPIKGSLAFNPDRSYSLTGNQFPVTRRLYGRLSIRSQARQIHFDFSSATVLFRLLVQYEPGMVLVMIKQERHKTVRFARLH